eukprot:CAMPEP_0116868594 /NCGR_PEP_ID=MMETSP0418-20121206/27283_1 /TAXON_ID=1158023 /ORGANISM="Astrosyne radiata, Strain 13vi08-1A" /LENGTH=694 /DNA_ID=CAMNT_0004504581 /DNA_START=140 /DNA_END=2224 /DNA_ORIENTATION=-
METDALLRIYDNGGHPNISGLRDMYEDYSHFYLILDLVSGGEMFEHLINYGAYSEADAARLVFEVVSALAFLHGVGVVHADLKPENLLLCSKNRRDGTIKMIDFGCSVVYDLRDDEAPDGGELAHANRNPGPSTGTTAYWPPERFKPGNTANPAMDMWSVGVILYIMLTGVHPFDLSGTSSDEEIEERIVENPHPLFGQGLTDHLSASAVDVIERLMDPDPNERITAYQLLQHPWVRGETASIEKMEDSDKRLSRYKDLRNKVEAGIFAVLVSQGHMDMTMSEISPQVLKNIRNGSSKSKGDQASSHIMKKAFDVFDKEGKGFVTSDDLERVVSERIGSHLSSSETEAFLESRQQDEGWIDDDPDAPEHAHGLGLSDFEQLSSGLKHRHFPRGHVIFHAGEEGDAMYFLNSGKVEVQTRKGQLVAILRSGDFFGEGSLLGDELNRFTTAKCATPVDVIQIKREDFERYVANSESTKNELRLKWRARSLAYAKNLIRLQKTVKTRVLKKGDVVYKEGEKGNAMFRVFDEGGGELEVSHGGRPVHKYVGGDSFGESSLLFERPRSSTVTCASNVCKLHEMRSEDFLAVVNASPEMATVLRNMCRKRLFKKAVKKYCLEKNLGLKDEDIVKAFHDADIDRNGALAVEEVRRLMHRMDPNFPMQEIRELLRFIDCDEDGMVSLEEFKRLFRQFEDEKQ